MFYKPTDLMQSIFKMFSFQQKHMLKCSSKKTYLQNVAAYFKPVFICMALCY